MTIASTIKALGARATMSDQDIRHHLHEDHKQFKEWTKKMAEGTRSDERARAFAQLKPALTAHARAEEATAYDGLIKSPDNEETDILGREGYVEHHIADHLVKRLSTLAPSTDEWRAHAKVLHEVLGHHIDEEETDIFAKLGDQFSRDELDALGTRFLRLKASIGASTKSKRSVQPVPRKAVKRKAAPVRAVAKTAKRVAGKTPGKRAAKRG